MNSENTNGFQTFKELFWFDHQTGRYICAKADDDEVYRVTKVDTSSTVRLRRSERYMTRARYEKFLSEYAELPIVLTNV